MEEFEFNELDEKRENLILESKNFFEKNKNLLNEKKALLLLNFEEISNFSIELADSLLTNAEETIQIFDATLWELGLIEKEIDIGFYNLPATQKINLRDLRSKQVGQLVEVEGIMLSSSEVRPKITNAKFECPSCGTIISVLQLDQKLREPSQCSCGRKSGFHLINKELIDEQILVLESENEKGKEKRRINVLIEGCLNAPSLENKRVPGIKLKVIGILQDSPLRGLRGQTSTRTELIIKANNIKILD